MTGPSLCTVLWTGGDTDPCTVVQYSLRRLLVFYSIQIQNMYNCKVFSMQTLLVFCSIQVHDMYICTEYLYKHKNSIFFFYTDIDTGTDCTEGTLLQTDTMHFTYTWHSVIFTDIDTDTQHVQLYRGPSYMNIEMSSSTISVCWLSLSVI